MTTPSKIAFDGRPTSRLARASGRSPRSPRLLVVDDNASAVMTLAARLSSEHFECRIAMGGEQAIAVAGDWLPDVIVMDISMPGLSGVEAALLLRRDKKTRAIVIVAFTALDEDEVRRQMQDHEFDGYCQKGQVLTHLIALVRGLIAR